MKKNDDVMTKKGLAIHLKGSGKSDETRNVDLDLITNFISCNICAKCKKPNIPHCKIANFFTDQDLNMWLDDNFPKVSVTKDIQYNTLGNPYQSVVRLNFENPNPQDGDVISMLIQTGVWFGYALGKIK